MTVGRHPLCQKPEDCRNYRFGWETLCAKCSGAPTTMREAETKQYHKLRDMFGPTRAKRLIIEDRS